MCALVTTYGDDEKETFYVRYVWYGLSSKRHQQDAFKTKSGSTPYVCQVFYYFS